MKSAVLDLCMNRDVAERHYEHIPDVELYLEITMVAGIVLILQGVCNKKNNGPTTNVGTPPTR